jgi:hypothetical protein
MQHFLPNSELLVKGNGRNVAVIGLHVDHPSVASRGNLAQMFDKGGRDAAAPNRKRHCREQYYRLTGRRWHSHCAKSWQRTRPPEWRDDDYDG